MIPQEADQTHIEYGFPVIYLLISAAKLKQASLFGGRSQAGFLIWNSVLYTHEKQFGTNILPSYFFLLRLKFHKEVIIKLGRVARLGNGPSLRGHNRRNGG